MDTAEAQHDWPKAMTETAVWDNCHVGNTGHVNGMQLAEEACSNVYMGECTKERSSTSEMAEWTKASSSAGDTEEWTLGKSSECEVAELMEHKSAHAKLGETKQDLSVGGQLATEKISTISDVPIETPDILGCSKRQDILENSKVPEGTSEMFCDNEGPEAACQTLAGVDRSERMRHTFANGDGPERTCETFANVEKHTVARDTLHNGEGPERTCETVTEDDRPEAVCKTFTNCEQHEKALDTLTNGEVLEGSQQTSVEGDPLMQQSFVGSSQSSHEYLRNQLMYKPQICSVKLQRLPETVTGANCHIIAVPTLSQGASTHFSGAGFSFSTEASRANPRAKSGFNLRRTRKRKSTQEVHSFPCPNCGKTVRSVDLEAHLDADIEKLNSIARNCKRVAVPKVSPSRRQVVTDGGETSEETPVLDGPARYKAFLKVRRNREKRDRAKSKRKPGPGEQETSCPVCSEHVVGTPDELAEHVDLCLREQEENIDVEGDSPDGSGEETGFEEYTWAGQTRVRATSMVDGGMAALGFQVASKDEDSDLDLNVDDDDSDMFGQTQYTEADLLPCTSEEPEEEKERRALRRAVLRAESGSCRLPAVPSDRKRWSHGGHQSTEPEIECVSDASGSRVMDDSQPESVPSTSSRSPVPESLQGVMDSLKAKLREQQLLLHKIDKYKCLICMEPYAKPLTSVQCWHVHCEECWLRTLGSKKLCPQCNAITSPGDLRRIYL